MTGAMTGELDGDAANQGLQKKKKQNQQMTLWGNIKNMVSTTHRKQAPEPKPLSNLIMTLQLWRIQNMVFQTLTASSGAPGKG